LLVQLSMALPVPGGGGVLEGGAAGGADGGGGETDTVGANNCERPDICSARRCIPRPPVTLLPGETATPVPALTNAPAAAGFDVESIAFALAKGTDAPVEALELGTFVRGKGACAANAVPPVERWLSLRVGIVDVDCERGTVLPAEPTDGAVIVA
jgi:hypothetical protein